MAAVVALLRGVNVGGARKLPMAELKTLLVSLGLDDVVTYIQSGNAVFHSPEGATAALAARIERQIEDSTGLDVTVLLRTPEELTEIERANPFGAGASEGSKPHVVFLERAPSRGAVARLDPERSPPDTFEVVGTEIYVHYPNGSGRSKLTLDYFERTLGVRGTARNWNTVVKLLDLARS